MTSSQYPQSLKLIKHVKRRVYFNAYVIYLIVLTVCGYMLFNVYTITAKNKVLAEKLAVSQSKLDTITKQVEPLLYRGDDEQNPVVAIVDGEQGSKLKQSNFYQDFNALTGFKIEGVWVTVIDEKDEGSYFRMDGGTDSSSKIDAIMSWLRQDPVFSEKSFRGVDIREAELKRLPQKYRAQFEKSMPQYYQFFVQTSAITEGDDE